MSLLETEMEQAEESADGAADVPTEASTASPVAEAPVADAPVTDALAESDSEE